MKSVLGLLLLSIVAITTGSYYHIDNGHYEHNYDDNGPALYHFSYGVNDPESGDKKSQHEVRDGHNVKGAYYVDDPDGTKRIVEYEAGPHSGFQAHVKRIGIAHHDNDEDDDDDYDNGHYKNGHYDNYKKGHYDNGHDKNGHYGNGHFDGKGHYKNGHHEDSDESAESYVGPTLWGYHH